MLNFLNQGLLHASWVTKVVYFLVVTQLTILSVTLYLHRSQAHRGVDFHPILAHFFRLWSWLSTGMVTKEWVAIHRKHHAKCETEEDPHSPQVYGLNKVLWEGVDLYRIASTDKAAIEKYGRGTPDDWLERHIYGAHPYLGPTLTFIIAILLFGIWGVAIAALQMVWIPFWAAGVVNGVGHWWGYRNFETSDTATNLTPWGFFIGGEELHNNHHAFPSSAKFSLRKFEFDIGWALINVFQKDQDGQGAARGAVARRASEHHPARFRNAEGTAHASLPGHDRLLQRRDRADAERRSCACRREHQIDCRARCARRSATAAAGSTNIRASACTRSCRNVRCWRRCANSVRVWPRCSSAATAAPKP